LGLQPPGARTYATGQIERNSDNTYTPYNELVTVPFGCFHMA